MNHFLLEIGFIDLPNEYLGMVKRIIHERLMKAFLECSIYFQEVLVESTKDRIIIYSDSLHTDEEVPQIKTSFKIIIPKILSRTTLPIYSQDTQVSTRFIDYITWIQCVYNGEPIEFENTGLASPKDSFLFTDFQDYRDKMANKSILVESKQRQVYFKQEARKIARSNGWDLVNNDHLIMEYASLYNFPTPVLGLFDKNHLSLNRELIAASLIEDYHLLPLKDDNGDLVAGFIDCKENFSRNYDISLVSQKVNQRLNEVTSLYKEDFNDRWTSSLEALKNYTYMEKTGTFYDQTQRIQEISSLLGQTLNVSEKTLEDAKKIASLSKLDLTTKLVREFPNLKGIIGMIYSSESKEKEIISKGLREYYKPKFLNDEIPTSTAASIVAVADRIEYLISFFINYGHNPLESSPQARKAGLSLIQIIIASNWTLNLATFLKDAIYVFLADFNILFDHEDIYEDIYHFLQAKLRDYLTQKGYIFYIIDSAIEGASFDIYDIYLKVDALAKITKSTHFKFLDLYQIIHEFVETHHEKLEEESEKEGLTSFLFYFTEQRQYAYFLDALWDLRYQILKKIDRYSKTGDHLSGLEILYLYDELNKIFKANDFLLIKEKGE